MIGQSSKTLITWYWHEHSSHGLISNLEDVNTHVRTYISHGLATITRPQFRIVPDSWVWRMYKVPSQMTVLSHTHTSTLQGPLDSIISSSIAFQLLVRSDNTSSRKVRSQKSATLLGSMSPKFSRLLGSSVCFRNVLGSMSNRTVPGIGRF